MNKNVTLRHASTGMQLAEARGAEPHVTTSMKTLGINTVLSDASIPSQNLFPMLKEEVNEVLMGVFYGFTEQKKGKTDLRYIKLPLEMPQNITEYLRMCFHSSYNIFSTAKEVNRILMSGFEDSRYRRRVKPSSGS